MPDLLLWYWMVTKTEVWTKSAQTDQSNQKNCCSWLWQYITVENMREKYRQKRTRQKTEGPTMAVRSALKQSEEKCPEGPRWKGMDLLLLWEGGDISSGIALRHLSHHWLHVQSAKDHTGEETTLSGVGIRSQVPGGPHTSPNPNNTWGTPGINNCGGSISLFLLDTGANFCVLTEAPDLLSSWSTAVMRLFWMSQMLSF